MRQNSSLNHYLRLHIIVFIWGFTAILGDLISLQALPLVWNRILIAVLVLLVFLWAKKFNFKMDKKALLTFALAGSLIAIHWVAFFHAIKISNVSITLVCMSSSAFFTSLLEPIFFKRKLYIYEVVLGLIVIGAIAVIFTVQTDYFWGILTALLAAFLSALFSVINGRIVHKYDSELITFYELLAGWITITSILFFSGNINASILPQSQSDWILLLVLGSICTAFPFIESVRVMRHLSPFTVILTINMEPVYGIILAFFILGEKERMTPTFYFGGLIIVATLFLNAWLRKRMSPQTV